MSASPRLNGRQITTIVVAICIAIVAFPVGVFAAANASSVTIADPTHPKQKVHVEGGKLLVGDGSGALTVDGGVSVSGAVSVNGTASVKGNVSVSGTVSTRSIDKTATLFSGSLVSGHASTTVATSSYGTIRVSVLNTDDTTCPLIILSTPDQAQAGIYSTLYQGNLTGDGHLSLVFETPGNYVSVTSSCTDDVQIFGRA
jgi:hypothetical protein